MARLFLQFLFISVWSLSSLGGGDCPSQLNCQYLGSLLVTPQGHQRVIELSLDKITKLLKSKTNSDLKNKVAGTSLTMYESPKDCELISELIDGDQKNEESPKTETFRTGKSSSTGEECLLYSTEDRNKFMPVKVSLEDISIHDFDYDIDDPSCDQYSCKIKTNLNKLKFSSRISIDPISDSTPTEIIRNSPYVVINVDEGGAIIDTNIRLVEKNNLHLLSGEVSHIRLDLSKARMTTIDSNQDINDDLGDGSSKKIFDNALNNPKTSEYLKKIVEKQMPVINEHIRTSLKVTSDVLNESILEKDFNTGILTVDLATMIRLENIKERIKELKQKNQKNDFSSNAKNSSPEKNQIRHELNKLKKDKEEIENYLSSEGQTLDVSLRTIFSQTDNFNRYGIFETNQGKCEPKIENLSDNKLVINNDELKNSDFALDVPIETIQKYLEDIWKKSEKICLNSTKKTCHNKVLVFEEKPEIKWNEDKKSYDIVINNAKGKNLGLFVNDQTFDMQLSANISKCENNFCLKLSDPQIKRKTKDINFINVGNDILDEKINTTQRQLETLFEEPIVLGNFSPPLLRESLVYGEPILKADGFIAPIQIHSLPDELFENNTSEILP